MKTFLITKVNQWLLLQLGRDRTAYLASNTMNLINQTLNPFVWTYDLKALVLDCIFENADVMTVSLLPNQHWQAARAGQYIELELMIDGQSLRRAYSISSIAGGAEQSITITIKKIKGGQVSNWLHQTLKKGLTLTISQAQGSFVYQDQAKVLFICAGSGITPCFSIVDQILKESDSKQSKIKTPDIQFFAQFSQAESVIFAESLQAWSQRFPVELALSQSDPSSRLSRSNFKQKFPDFQQRSIYLCGPEGFMNEVITILEQENDDFSQLHVEQFVEKQYTSTFQTTGTVYFKHYNHHISLTAADQGKTLLELGLEQGLNLEKGCQRGICGSCKLVLHAGAVSGNHLGKAVYLCTAYPNSDYLELGT